MKAGSPLVGWKIWGIAPQRSIRFAIPFLLVFALIGWNPAYSQSYSWIGGEAGTWNDTDDSVWDPTGIPAPSNNVVINRAGGASVLFDSDAFDDPADFLNHLTIGGNGDANILEVGTGQTLYVNGEGSPRLELLNGGTLRITGGSVRTVGDSEVWTTPVDAGNGSSIEVSAGELLLRPRDNLNLADRAGESATMTISGTGWVGGEIPFDSARMDIQARAGNSIVTISDQGTLQPTRRIQLGTLGGDHVWTMTGGSIRKGDAQSENFLIGNNNGNGSVTFNQSGGVFFTQRVNFDQWASVDLGSTATYTLSGNPADSRFEIGNLILNGVFNQNGGRMDPAFELRIGTVADTNPVYTATAGEIAPRSFRIGETADTSGTLILHEGVVLTTGSTTNVIGATSGTGTGVWELRGYEGAGNSTQNVTVRQTGTIRGYGAVAGLGTLIMNGTLIADGMGQDRTLSFVNHSVPVVEITNTGSLGLYAIDGGRLELRNVAVAAGNSAVSWGDSQAASSPSMVNSVRLSFTNATAGALTGALLAIDRTDIPEYTFLGDVISVHQFTSNFSFDSLDMIFRYDDSLVADASLLRLFHYTGGVWNEVADFSIDSALSQFHANNIQSFSLFALTVIPEPSSTGLLALAGIGAWLLRRKKNHQKHRV